MELIIVGFSEHDTLVLKLYLPVFKELVCFIFLRIDVILIQKVCIDNFLSFGIHDLFALELCEFIFEAGCSFAGLLGAVELDS